MGMTDKQFNGFIRLLIKNIKEALKKKNQEEMTAQMEEILQDLQTIIED